MSKGDVHAWIETGEPKRQLVAGDLCINEGQAYSWESSAESTGKYEVLRPLSNADLRARFGLTAERRAEIAALEACAKILRQAREADALTPWFTNTDEDGVDVDAALAQLMEVRRG